jgi:hypothetical protein
MCNSVDIVGFDMQLAERCNQIQIKTRVCKLSTLQKTLITVRKNHVYRFYTECPAERYPK